MGDVQIYIADTVAVFSLVYSAYAVRGFRKESKEKRGEDQRFLDTLKGVKKMPGVEEKPSLVERFVVLEKKTDDQSVILKEILNQLAPDHGTSLVSKVDSLNGVFIDHLGNHSEEKEIQVQTTTVRRRSKAAGTT